MKSCRNSQTIMIGTYKNISITQQLLETIEIIDWLSKNCFDKSWVLLRDFFELLSNIFFLPTTTSYVSMTASFNYLYIRRVSFLLPFKKIKKLKYFVKSNMPLIKCYMMKPFSNSIIIVIIILLLTRSTTDRCHLLYLLLVYYTYSSAWFAIYRTCHEFTV